MRRRPSSRSTTIPTRSCVGTAPALLLDPQERLERLEAAGLAVTVVQHFDDALRRTPYDAFVERIRSRLTLSGFLMTPDAAFGFERRGTPATLAALGARDGFEVVVVPPFTIDGHEVRSSDDPDRDRARATSRARHGCSVGRSRSRASIGDPVDGGARLEFRLPVALPPDGDYDARVDGAPRDAADRADGDAYLVGQVRRSGASRSSSEPSERRRQPPPRISGRRVRVLRLAPGGSSIRSLCLPGGFTGLVMSLATRFTAVVPRAWARRVPLRLGGTAVSP